MIENLKIGYEEDMIAEFLKEYNKTGRVEDSISKVSSKHADDKKEIKSLLFSLYRKNPQLFDYVKIAVKDGILENRSELIDFFIEGLYQYNAYILFQVTQDKDIKEKGVV